MINISHGDDYMIASKTILQNTNTSISTIEELDTYIKNTVGEDIFMEVVYTRSDAILDGIATEYGSYYWDNETKAGHYIIYHKDMLDAKSFQLNHLQNDKIRTFEQKLKEAGWHISMVTDAVEIDPTKTDYLLVDHPSNQASIRPERRNA